MRMIAERLRYLLVTHRRPNGKKWTIRQIVTILNQRGYPQINRGSIAAILRGEADPRISHLKALSSFFNVPVAYFYEPNHPMAEEEALLSQALSDAKNLQIYLEMSRLSESGKKQVIKIYSEILNFIKGVSTQEISAQSEDRSIT